MDDLDGRQAVRHGGELGVKSETTLCVDAAHSGVGGVDSWGMPPLPQHLIAPDQRFHWAFRLRPMAVEDLEDFKCDTRSPAAR